MGLNRFYCLSVLAGACVINILASNQCDIPNKGKTGTKDSVVLSLYRCSQATSSKEPVCLTKPSSQEVLKRGKVVDMNHDVNGYAVTAKYFGDEVCVAYREKSSIRSHLSGYKITNKCSSECFRDLEFETYETELVCSQISCGGGWDKLKFVVTDSASGPAIISFAVMTICSVLSSSFAS